MAQILESVKIVNGLNFLFSNRTMTNGRRDLKQILKPSDKCHK
jgi:hypothetical protein